MESSCSPPNIIEKIYLLAFPHGVRNDKIGDFQEDYHGKVIRHGLCYARFWCVVEVFRNVGPVVWQRFQAFAIKLLKILTLLKVFKIM